jgi:hypothetical protein
MKSTLDQIEDIKKNGYTIDFGTTFNYAFENYKKIALYSGLIVIVLTAVVFALAFGIIGAIYGLKTINQQFIENNLNLQNLTYLQQVITVLALSAFTALCAPIGAGFLKMADCADKDEEFNFSTIFTYYKAPYFSQLVIATFIIGLISNSIATLIESFGILYLGGAISFFISFLTFLAAPLIVFGNLNAIDALKSSLIVISKNPLLLFGLFLTGIIGVFVGFVGCCIGVIFTAVFSTSITYATYFSIFTEEEQREDSIDSIGQSDLE